jgi:hypothetical protein
MQTEANPIAEINLIKHPLSSSIPHFGLSSLANIYKGQKNDNT